MDLNRWYMVCAAQGVGAASCVRDSSWERGYGRLLTAECAIDKPLTNRRKKVGPRMFTIKCQQYRSSPSNLCT
jgi:hypothetical protein